jgi:two-component system response regulator HydG
MTRPDSYRVLIVDDHAEMARLLADELTDVGYRADVAHGGRDALALARDHVFDAVITDLRMEDLDGFDLLAAIHQHDPALPVLIMTAFGAIDTAIDAIKRGAYHYLTKPFRLDEVRLYIERAIADRRLRDENRALRRIAAEQSGVGGIIGHGPAMRQLHQLIERVAAAQAPALVRGESGVGKELVARALHFLGPRRDRPFIAVNCTALPEALLESELFGHVRGAYTGATTARRGLLVEADGGTLFLDEIGDMAPELQSKLLRTIEDGEVRAVGADLQRTIDVRIVSATHQDLERKVRHGEFRADLFYRLHVVPLLVPPLRDRVEDIPELVEHFLHGARERNPASRVERLSSEALAELAQRRWYGNVRELRHLVERVVITCTRETVGVEDLPHEPPLEETARGAASAGGVDGLHGVDAPHAGAEPLALARQRMVTLKQLESDYIAWVIGRCGGNKTRAAEILGIDVSTIHRRGKDRGGGLH